MLVFEYKENGLSDDELKVLGKSGIDLEERWDGFSRLGSFENGVDFLFELFFLVLLGHFDCE